MDKEIQSFQFIFIGQQYLIVDATKQKNLELLSYYLR